MFVHTALLSILAVAGIQHVAGAPVDVGSSTTTLNIGDLAGAADGSAIGLESSLIGTSVYYACNAPHNGKHHAGSPCKFYSGPTDKSPVSKGKCEWQGPQLNCVVT